MGGKPSTRSTTTRSGGLSLANWEIGRGQRGGGLLGPQSEWTSSRNESSERVAHIDLERSSEREFVAPTVKTREH